jgi:hypothetical protein
VPADAFDVVTDYDRGVERVVAGRADCLRDDRVEEVLGRGRAGEARTVPEAGYQWFAHARFSSLGLTVVVLALGRVPWMTGSAGS